MNTFTDAIDPGVLEEIKTIPWYRHGIYRDHLLSSSMQVGGYMGQTQFKSEGLPEGIKNIIILNDSRFLDDSRANELTAFYAKQLAEQGTAYIRSYLTRHKIADETLLAYSRSIQAEDFASKTNTELAAIFAELLLKMQGTIYWLWSLEFLNPALEAYLRERLSQAFPKWKSPDIDAFLTKISVSSEKLPFQKEKERIVHGELDENALHGLYSEFLWLDVNYWDGRPFTYERYVARVKALGDDAATYQQVQDLNISMQEADAATSTMTDEDLRELILLTRGLITHKSYRIDIASMSRAATLPLFDEIARRIGISSGDFEKLLCEEVMDILRGSAIPSDLQDRSPYIHSIVNGKLRYFRGKAAQEIEKILLAENYAEVRSFKGVTGHKGIVQGRAKVLLTDRDISKLEKGDILVANLTNPNFNPAFALVSGVVTDEGGILCHSAIMAREFKIPCIIGTKIATRALKDGDLIEVDANSGTVRKVS